ncbi:MAG: thioredoxin family protein [Bacilli bacterium]|nr:thioredoxin family protein [Bacilli bacterium]
MKVFRIFPFVFLLSFDSGNITQEDNTITIETYSYDDIIDITIKWDDIFAMTPRNYFVYFYSLYCGHCQSIKDLVINYSKRGEITMYFVEASTEVVVAKDTHLTIGAMAVEQLWILGYPSLVEIENGAVVINIAGANAIKEILLYK